MFSYFKFFPLIYEVRRMLKSDCDMFSTLGLGVVYCMQKIKTQQNNSEKVKCIHTKSTFEWMLILQAFNMEHVWRTFWKFYHFSRIFIFDFRYFNFSGCIHLADAILVLHNPNDSIVFPHASHFFERFAFFIVFFCALGRQFSSRSYCLSMVNGIRWP